MWEILNDQNVNHNKIIKDMFYNSETKQLEGEVEIPDKGIAKSIMNKVIYGTTIPEQEKYDRHIQK